MIWLEELQNRKKVSKIFYHYEKTFPPQERREKDQFLALADHPMAYVFSIQKENVSVGYAILWELKESWFVEHFEIFEEYRNNGLGSDTLTALQEKFPCIILETEPETSSENAQRRLNFYRRNGFNSIETHYTQPSYGSGKAAVVLLLMANYEVSDLAHLIREIHTAVYGN